MVERISQIGVENLKGLKSTKATTQVNAEKVQAVAKETKKNYKEELTNMAEAIKGANVAGKKQEKPLTYRQQLANAYFKMNFEDQHMAPILSDIMAGVKGGYLDVRALDGPIHRTFEDRSKKGELRGKSEVEVCLNPEKTAITVRVKYTVIKPNNLNVTYPAFAEQDCKFDQIEENPINLLELIDNDN